ncbi:MAG: hypothetical protein M1830_005019 [Pleopsidium flavum]|nr:MAG: hypothetical protein M1830_005019 [Pleopsidium flavum]
MPKSSTLSVTLSHPPMTADDGSRLPTTPMTSTSLDDQSSIVRGAVTHPKNPPRTFSARAVSLLKETQGASELSKSPTFTSLPLPPTSLKSIPKHARDPANSFFSNIKASKSSSRLQPAEGTIRHVGEETSTAEVCVSENNIYSLRPSSRSSPDLSNPTSSNSEIDKTVDNTYQDTHQDSTVTRPPTGTSAITDQNSANNLMPKRSKPRFPRLLTRTRSIRPDEPGRRFKPSTPTQLREGKDALEGDSLVEEKGMKTAPLEHEKDRSYRDFMGPNIRNRSADRQDRADYGASNTGVNPDKKDPHTLTFSASTVFKDGTGSNLFSNIKNTSTRAADGIGKAGKGLLGKITRSGSSNSKEVTEDQPYALSIINLPLVEQTRRTRIAKRLEDSKDKTEFWMPALPWRCIDYLNFRGCEEEGLYRVPGSGPRIKEWQRRFDRELDINLFDEPTLYDINIIGSIFKAWLRDLPDEIFPKVTQAQIAAKCMGATTTPQMLKDELSKLPPWNYYLLFAITCHLSLLNSYVEKNKMNYGNLCICFQPCLKVDPFCFRFLVCDWRNCWQGCWTEKQALAEEYAVLDGLPTSAGGSSGASMSMADERAVSSSDSNKPPFTGDIPEKDKKRPPALKLTKPSTSDLSSTPTKRSKTPDKEKLRPPALRLTRPTSGNLLSTPRRNGDTQSDNGQPGNGQSDNASHLPELSPVMPLSPLGI